MWIFTTTGFISVVQTNSANTTKGLDEYTVRARDKDSLLRYFSEGNVLHTPDGDYHWRAFTTKAKLAEILATELDALGYQNFKDAVQESAGNNPRDREFYNLCLDTWCAGRVMQTYLSPLPRKVPAKRKLTATKRKSAGKPAKREKYSFKKKK